MMKVSLADQLEVLQRCLEGSERPLAFLLGAGCACSIRVNDKPAIPDLAGLTRLLAEDAQNWENDPSELFRELFCALRDDERSLETLLTQVRMLRKLSESLTSPQYSVEQLTHLDERICKFTREHVQGSITPQQVRESGFGALARWISSVDRKFPVQIFTTNYDLLIERAFEDSQVPYYDGFIGSSEAFFDEYSIDEEEPHLPARWARLWKLHGSVSWWYLDDGESNRVIRSHEPKGSSNMIFPSHLKYDQAKQMPFLVMFDRLRRHLQKRSAVLVCVGFSFADEHVTSTITQALRPNPQSTLIALQYGSLCDSTQAVNLGLQCPNASIICTDGGVIGGSRYSKWASQSAAVGSSTGLNYGDFANLRELLQNQSHAANQPVLAVTHAP